MSTYWGFYCKQCDQESEHWYNHGQQRLQQVYAAWPHVKAIAAISEDMTVSVLGSGNPWPFLAAHDGHPLVLSNEYGQRWSLPAGMASPAPPPSKTAAPDPLHDWINHLHEKMRAAQAAAAHYEQLYLLEREINRLQAEKRRLEAASNSRAAEY